MTAQKHRHCPIQNNTVTQEECKDIKSNVTVSKKNNINDIS